jgi:hypothetical protein
MKTGLSADSMRENSATDELGDKSRVICRLWERNVCRLVGRQDERQVASQDHIDRQSIGYNNKRSIPYRNPEYNEIYCLKLEVYRYLII